MDAAREPAAVSGTVLIPMRFVWPYGGKSVFLSGSFNRWYELLPMSPVEGCPTVFQIIWSIPPGYHQYKFCVDGEWRHDEHQPFISSEYGIVNTVLLATEPNFMHGINQGTPSGSNMDVDNEAFQRLVQISDGSLTEAMPRISEADLQVSRHRVSVFLSTHTAYELLPESGKVVALDKDLPVKQAFHILYEQGISMAPLWDFSKAQFVGVLSASDFILILREALQLGQDSYSPYELRSQRCQMCLPSDVLHKVMERLANPGVRRLVIVEAGSKRVEGIVSLSDIFRFLLG